MFHMKLFIDTDADSRLSKRVLKDVDELGRDLDQVKIPLRLWLIVQSPGSSPVYQLCQARLRGVLYAHQEIR